MKARPGFAAMAIQFGEGVDAAEDCMKSSLAITAKGSLDLGDIRLGLQGAVSGINIDDIQLGDELGRGASSKVHLAILRTNGQKLAIKCLLNVHDKELRKQLRAELHFMEKLNVAGCPFISQIYDGYFHDDKVWLVLEFCGNGELKKNIETHGPMPEETLSFTVRCIFLALNYLFYNAVLHRDMKPANCLISEDGVVKLSDFGSSKRLGTGGDELDAQMLAGTFTGTMQYMSPERLNGGGTGYSWPADVWSAGLIMLECAMGQHPYAAIGETGGFMSMQDCACNKPTPAINGYKYAYDEEAQNFVELCLQKDPCQRPAPIYMVNEESVHDSHPFILKHKDLGPGVVLQWMGKA